MPRGAGLLCSLGNLALACIPWAGQNLGVDPHPSLCLGDSCVPEMRVGQVPGYCGKGKTHHLPKGVRTVWV